MRLRVVAPFAIGMLFLLGGWNACGDGPQSAGEDISASIPTTVPAEPVVQAEPEEPLEPGIAGEPGTDATPAEPDAPAVGAQDDRADPGGGPACTEVPDDLPLAERCAMAGAVVHTFPNTCRGSCKAKEQMMMCGQAMSDGCKCPDGQCIDDEAGCCRDIRR